ncbi:uncharacterized protein conserved in bacteria [Gracilibacillus boraciitolerans JCM 21714]|uniref:Uncharacterized protein conserved in bacteria n=1 Tax=Gracilibacillus boraciitolerans JCM 21714 TaxID=1298598 RepID=W4VMR3_9BACI|nr:MOSC domain-containing protein [Gracilibacillus boraciitolerans]GAE94411.1 uncharacterized protein conserved in bacteria [Gracilibacillus boraciitolerans JCM 21714]
MEYTIISLNVGKPAVYQLDGQNIETGFIKRPIDKPNYLTVTGFKDDGQADLKNHGGKEKALLMYPKEHYNFWNQRYQQQFPYPSFGENITIDGLTEREVYIGEIFQLGQAEIQVSQPRQPCYKIARTHGIKDMPAVVTDTGYGGYYFRVLKEGWVAPADTLKKLQEVQSHVSAFDIFHCLFHDQQNKKRMQEYLQLSGLASNVKARFQKRIDMLR